MTIIILVIITILTNNNKLKNKMSNTLWKIRFSNYEPIDLRDIESYHIKQNVDDILPIRADEYEDPAIEKKIKDTILSKLNTFFRYLLCDIFHNDVDFQGKDLYKQNISEYNEEIFIRDPYKEEKICPFRDIVEGYLKDIVEGYLKSNENLFANDFHNIKKWKEKVKFAKGDIFKHFTSCTKRELKNYLILKDREKLFTVEFELKDKKTVKWGAYKTEKEVEIVYNKVDGYFKKTFEHFYKNLENQEIYSL